MKHFFRGMALFCIAILIQLTILPPNAAYANEEQIPITQLAVQVMPEFINPEDWDYMKPSLLIGYHGTATNTLDEAFDGEIRLSIPTHLPDFRVGFVAQYIEETGEQVELEYTVNDADGYISMKVPEAVAPGETFLFIVEHFSASIEGVVERSFDFTYVAETDHEQLNITILSPFGSHDFIVSEEAHEINYSFGVEIQLFEFYDIPQGKDFHYDVTYNKESIVTTMEAFDDLNPPDDQFHGGVNPDVENPHTQQDTGFFTTENVIMISLSIIIVGAFIFLILRNQGKEKKTKSETKAAPKKIVNKEEEIKKLRKMLADGQIDEKTYKEKRAKLD